MKPFLASVCSGLLLLGWAAFAADPDSHASVYSGSEATSELPVLHIAKGLPPIKEVGTETARRVWESYRTFTPTKKLIPVRSRKTTPVSVSPATAVTMSRE